MEPVNHCSVVSPSGPWPYYILFFVSGFPALIYQIVWQRALFTLYGVDIQSVTIVVSVFMLGLGLGSLAGGWVSKQAWIRLLPAYGAIEVLIGAFGAGSLAIFHRVGLATAGASLPMTALVSFAVLLIPTVLMGSTLPLLVEHFVRRNGNVGESVGILYAVNTLGSAAACIAAAYLLMGMLGESGSVRLSACINVLVGATALLVGKDRQQGIEDDRRRLATGNKEQNSEKARFGLGIFLAGAAGFVALGYEIIWYRVYSFTTGGSAPCFAELLAFYLAGIGYGSLAVRDACRKKLRSDLRGTLRTAGTVVLWGAVAAFLVAPLVARFVTIVRYELTFVFVFVAAALMGSAFPLISHAFIDPEKDVGSRISLFYFSNIVGSTLGSFVIGFVISDYLSTRAISVLLLCISLAVASTLTVLSGTGLRRRLIAGAVVCVALAMVSRPMFDGLYERLLAKTTYSASDRFAELTENRSGVISVTDNGTVFGGGAYDGQFNVDLVHDSNRLFRIYAMAGINRTPHKALMIGLASGSWAQVLVNHPDVQDLTIVEINPGYLPLIQKREMVRSLLTNPKVHVVIDDGRRWLASHADERFDMIVINTTWHWRANSSNLLSTEFMEILRRHLTPGGVAYYNTTWAPEALATGATTFPYALRIYTFLAVSDQPIALEADHWKSALVNYQIDGKPVLDLARQEDRAKLDELMEMARSVDAPRATVESRDSLLRRVGSARLITDDNMGTEWRGIFSDARVAH